MARSSDGTELHGEEIKDKLYSAVLADILDDHGYRNQAIDSGIRPISPAFKTMGRAFTVLATDVYEMPDNPYEKELAAVASLSSGDVLVATTNGSTSCGFWGELLSTAALSNGALGAVIDGFTRDSSRIVDLNFPVFVRGYSPLDSKGRLDVISYSRPISCGGVQVCTGDLVFADRDGVVVIPARLVSEVLPKALEKVVGEDEMRHALKQGMGVVQAYREHGIL